MTHRQETGARKLLAAALFALLCLSPAAHAESNSSAASRPLLPAPIWVYNNWSAYDELSDHVPLNETLAMRELREIVRLRRSGVRFDYYTMDAFWFDPDGGYRKWRAESWPHGPEPWIAAVEANGMKPGLWFSTNTLGQINPAPAWRSSLNTNGTAMAFYTGGFLADFMDVLQFWYGRGIRVFKFDFADFDVAARGDESRLSPAEIRSRNMHAFHAALQSFRRRNPDVILVAFNGFVDNVESARAPMKQSYVYWLDVFDSLYSGDPRPSNVPETSFWRSMDIYSDHMVRRFASGGVPLSRIDSTSFMIGDTATNYHRGAKAWQGSLLLMVAHGGWINTVHGNLEFLDDDQARWFAKLQAMYAPLQQAGITKSFGDIPADRRPYGFGSLGADGALYLAVNPSQSIETVALPLLAPRQKPVSGGRVLFRDAGFEPALDGDAVRLGPGQLVLIGFGRYADPAYELGIQMDVLIPKSIVRLPARFTMDGDAAIETTIIPPKSGDLRVVMRQRDGDNAIIRSVSRANMAKVFVIAAVQGGQSLPVEIHYDKVVWSGLGWAVGEIRHANITPGEPLRIRIVTTDPDPSLHLDGWLYQVKY